MTKKAAANTNEDPHTFVCAAAFSVIEAALRARSHASLCGLSVLCVQCLLRAFVPSCFRVFVVSWFRVFVLRVKPAGFVDVAKAITAV